MAPLAPCWPQRLVEVKPHTDAEPAFDGLKRQGAMVRDPVGWNPSMLPGALLSSAFPAPFQAVLSVDTVRVYKTRFACLRPGGWESGCASNCWICSVVTKAANSWSLATCR